jgi:hypothetical protein
MSSPSREHLLGYLLGALSPEEHEQIATEINHNPTLQAEMQRLKACVEHVGLTDEPADFEPPVGLAERTCQFVAASARQVALSAGRFAGSEVERHRFTWSDLVTVAAVVVAAASMFFPALSFSRFQSQIATCQNQLRLIGYGMQEYSNLQPDHSFPGPEAEGPRSAAGVAAGMLVSNGLAKPQMFLCPAAYRSHNSVRLPRMPLPEELDRATGKDLLAMQKAMGGDFGFNMGYTANGKLMRPTNSWREQYGLAGDAPSNSQPRRASANHAGRGQNVVYEDGHVKFLRDVSKSVVLDDPFHNRDGWVAAGVDRDDAVLGASEDAPIPVRLISNQ